MRAKKLPRYLSPDQVLLALENSAGELRLFIESAYCTGARVSELLALRWSDVDLEEGTAIVKGKGDKERVVYLGGSVRALRLARDGHRPDVLLFSTTSQQMRDRLAALGRRLGFRLTPHVLRHSMATAMLDNGAPLPVVAGLLGHESWRTTADHYWQLADPRLQALRRCIVTCLPRARRYWLAHPASWSDVQAEQVDP